MSPNGYFIDIFGYRSGSTTFKNLAGDLEMSAKHDHYMFGDEIVSGARCPNCAEDLTPILLLDLTDPRLAELSSYGKTMGLYYCLQCTIPSGPFQYRLEESGSLTVLNFHADTEPSKAWDGYRRKFTKAPASLLELSDDVLGIVNRV